MILFWPMRNKIRLFLLVAFIALLSSLGYMFTANFKGVKSPVKISLGETGIDIAIENFNVSHDELGNTIWELKAKSAKINSTSKITQLTGVEVVLHQKDNKQSYIFADIGILNDATKDYELIGHVRLISNSDLISDHFR